MQCASTDFRSVSGRQVADIGHKHKVCLHATRLDANAIQLAIRVASPGHRSLNSVSTLAQCSLSGARVDTSHTPFVSPRHAYNAKTETIAAMPRKLN